MGEKRPKADEGVQASGPAARAGYVEWRALHIRENLRIPCLTSEVRPKVYAKSLEPRLSVARKSHKVREWSA